MPDKKKFKEIDHTADTAIEVYGKDMDGLFENALRGLIYLVFGGRESSGRSRLKKIELEAPSPEELLVDFLNEVLYLINAREIIPIGGRVSVKGNKLKSKLDILKQDRRKNIKQEIKAATYHKLDIKRRGGEFKIEVFFDI